MSSRSGSDAGTNSNAGETTANAGEATVNAGETTSDGGKTIPDGGEAIPDGGKTNSNEGHDGRQGGAWNWLLLEGNRLHIASAVIAAIALALVAVLWTLGFPSVRAASPIYFLFSGLITGDLTLVTVVLSINQLVLSRELGAPGTLTERVKGALDYRSEVADATETPVTPESPTEFLQFLHEHLQSRAGQLRTEAAEATDDRLAERLRDLATSLDADVALIVDSLEPTGDPVFEVVSATLGTNHADQLQQITRIRHDHADALTDDAEAALDATRSLLLQIDVARSYFKTVYVQKELAYLSRILLYVGLPAIVIDGLALVFYNALGPLPLPTAAAYLVTTVAFTLGFAPLAILFAFVLRLAWVAQRTATVAPFSAEREYSP